ncbi:type II toxin-antitoxin system HicB family antitoxin [Streptomyces sp. NPDC097619]|uniref:type II toxin-antitoxin system HicB family antitoxin n=1 Tax=Streptomyces sp. NPDC097619 TaxID=3157228 RepID=UPI00331FB3A5
MQTITVLYHQEGGSWWAESRDVAGFAAVGDSLAEVRGLVQDGLPFYLEGEPFEFREQVSQPRPGNTVKILNASPSAPMWLQGSQDDVAPVVVVTGTTATVKVVMSSPTYA